MAPFDLTQLYLQGPWTSALEKAIGFGTSRCSLMLSGHRPADPRLNGEVQVLRIITQRISWKRRRGDGRCGIVHDILETRIPEEDHFTCPCNLEPGCVGSPGKELETRFCGCSSVIHSFTEPADRCEVRSVLLVLRLRCPI